MATEDLEIPRTHPDDEPRQPESPRFNAEIDTSAPIQSVREAAKRFGGMGFWRPVSHKPDPTESPEPPYECETVDADELEEQLAMRRKETLDILEELESTKNVVEELKSILQNRASTNASSTCVVLMDLKQAKLNLLQTTGDLAGIRATVDAYKTSVEKERFDLEAARRRLASAVSKASALENELNMTTMAAAELRNFKLAGEAARREIEETKTRIRAAEIQLAAARKTKEAARASESVALAEIKALVGEEISRKAEEAREEVRASKRALEEALSRAEAANEGKSAAEEALRKWRSRHRRQQNDDDILKKPSLSIGQILSRKLLLSEYENDDGMQKPRVSLGEMLMKKKMMKKDDETVKRKKLSFPMITLMVRKQSKKKMRKHINLCSTI